MTGKNYILCAANHDDFGIVAVFCELFKQIQSYTAALFLPLLLFLVQHKESRKKSRIVSHAVSKYEYKFQSLYWRTLTTLTNSHYSDPFAVRNEDILFFSIITQNDRSELRWNCMYDIMFQMCPIPESGTPHDGWPRWETLRFQFLFSAFKKKKENNWR